MTPRQIAQNEGLAQYRGKPCRRHPGALRWTSNGYCVACHVEKKKARQRANPEYFRAKQRARHSMPEEQRACFHYTNLQPLWKRDNRAKNSRGKACAMSTTLPRMR